MAYLLSGRLIDASFLSMTSIFKFIVILSDSEGSIVHFAYWRPDASYFSMTIIRLYSATRSPKIASSKKLGISVFWV